MRVRVFRRAQSCPVGTSSRSFLKRLDSGTLLETIIKSLVSTTTCPAGGQCLHHTAAVPQSVVDDPTVLIARAGAQSVRLLTLHLVCSDKHFPSKVTGKNCATQCRDATAFLLQPGPTGPIPLPHLHPSSQGLHSSAAHGSTTTLHGFCLFEDSK